MDIEIEYTAAKDEYEAADSALARARRRLDLAARAMCDAHDKRRAELEARATERDRRIQK